MESDVQSALRAAGRLDCEIRIEAWVWCVVGEVGDRVRAEVIRVVQVFSAEGSRLGLLGRKIGGGARCRNG